MHALLAAIDQLIQATCCQVGFDPTLPFVCLRPSDFGKIGVRQQEIGRGERDA